MTFCEWKLCHGPTAFEDPAGQSRALMEMAWNGAIEAAAEHVLAYARRHADIRAAALEVAAERLRDDLISPRVCGACGQSLKEKT